MPFLERAVIPFLMALLFGIGPCPWTGHALAASDTAPAGQTAAKGPRDWKIGYWYWQGWSSYVRPLMDEHQPKIDILYAHVGSYDPLPGKGRVVDAAWPDCPPPSDAYVAVLRCKGKECTDRNLVPGIVQGYEGLKARAAQRAERVVGLQIDYDCPTRDLAGYGKFLSSLREAMPKEDMLSVTCLLDWFRPGTKIGEVLRWADEFVPQFYDVDAKALAGERGGVAEPVDAARWAPLFNRYGKPYRIGIATFGRLVRVPKGRSSSPPEEIGTGTIEVQNWDRGTFVAGGLSRAGEGIAYFRYAGAKTPRQEENVIKLVTPTRQSVLRAYEASKAMGALCRGVVFFRIALSNERLVLSPVEVFRVLSGGKIESDRAVLESKDGLCAAVSCSDLFLAPKDRFSPKETIVTISSSRDLDYYVPDRLVQSRMRGPRLIEVRIPPYAGLARIPIGRAMSAEPSLFKVEEEK